MSTGPGSTRWREIDDLFNRALALEPDERTRFVAERCGDDPSRRREVLELLRLDALAGGFLGPVAARTTVRALATALLDDVLCGYGQD